ncbi:aminotransferase class V-fold PLP-dependent enzyme [Solicola sp. PLA-1-18]|uniref:aminotransferase class V-fold PLP-dependent enzyme n=1 Tax=Solicola sp. PLA-1-18 TaxID=3380532 RepID=UPI003B7FEB3F
MLTDVADLFGLDPDTAHLNHGAFGTVPRAVRDAQRRWQDEAERNPHHFHRVRLPALMATARERAAAFVGVPPDEAALVHNISEAVSTVLASLDLVEGDEVVVCSHGYGAVRLAVEHWVERRGAVLVEAAFDVGADDTTVVAAYADATSPRTRLVVVDAITSPTATVLPVAGVVAAVDAPVLVDAAHVPGSAPVDVRASGATYWAGNLHKWAHTSRGTAVLWTSPSAPPVHPLVLSWNLAGPRGAWFDHPGTGDYSGWLAVGDGLDVWESLGGWTKVDAMTAVASDAQALLADAWGTSLDGLPVVPAPTMRLVRPPAGVLTGPEDVDRVYRALSDDHGVEVAPQWFGGEPYVRVAAGPYTDLDDVRRLADALPACRA